MEWIGLTYRSFVRLTDEGIIESKGFNFSLFSLDFLQ